MPTEEISTDQHAEQFVSEEQQRYSAVFGMWIFLATEVLFFGGPLAAYTVYRVWYPTGFAVGSRHLDFALGTLNTAILLTSSFLMAGSISAARLGDLKTTMRLLILTAGCGLTFLAVKGYEWYSVISEGNWPGTAMQPGQPPGLHLFYSLYFTLTGLHAIHLLIGITLLLVTALSIPLRPSALFNQNRLTLLGLYWHFVDIIWIFLYPLLYFIGRSS
jgi:cytochrome c oxidase subunit 3